MILPVEDELSDILSKAQKGLGLSTETLSARTGLEEGVIRSLRRGEFEEEPARIVAAELGLNVEAAVKIGTGSWRPPEIGPIDGFKMIATPFYDWHVNAFVVWERDTGSAIAFDTGTDAAPMVRFLQENRLDLRALILTHTHRDHIQGLDVLRSLDRDLQIFVNRQEESVPPEAELIEEGYTYHLGSLTVEAIETPGHTQGGMSYVVKGLPREVAIVGDALFAGSMGGANVSYQDGLRSLAKLLELPDSTILAPGHGPLTTVAEEKRMNAFSGATERI